MEVQEGQVLHLLFNPSMDAVLREQRMMHVTNELRSMGYEVRTNFTSELVLTDRSMEPFTKNDLRSVGDWLLSFSFLAVIPNTVHNPTDGNYGYKVPLLSIEVDETNGTALITFPALSQRDRELLTAMTDWMTPGQRAIDSRRIFVNLLDVSKDVTRWEIKDSSLAKSDRMILVRGLDGCTLILQPRFGILRELLNWRIYPDSP